MARLESGRGARLCARAVRQAEEAPSGVAVEMRMTVVDVRDAEAAYTILAGHAVRQASRDQPVEHAILGVLVVWLCFVCGCLLLGLVGCCRVGRLLFLLF